MDTGPHPSKGWDENINDIAYLQSGRPPDSIPASRISAQPTSTLVKPSAVSTKLPSLSCVLKQSSPSLSLVGSQPAFTIGSDGLRRSAAGASFPSEPSLKRPRLSSGHGSGSESDISISIFKDRLSKPNTHQESFSSNKSAVSRPAANSHCAECALIKLMIQDVISRIRSLESECHRASTTLRYNHPAKEGNIGLATSINAEQSDLEKQLVWAATVVERSTTLIGELAVDRGQLPILSTVSPFTSLLPQDSSTVLNSAPPDLPTRRSVDAEHDKNDFQRKLSVQMHHATQLVEQPFTIPGDRPNAPFSSLAYPQPVPQSPWGFMPSSGPPTRLQSPLQGQVPSQMLPSPSSLSFQSTPGQQHQLAMSPGLNAPAYASHVQDLQHQSSTKSLAFQALQREHDNLLAAYSHQQTRCLALDKKTKVSDDEIKTLTEEKTKLQSQVEALEAQVDELVKSKEEVHRQSAASGAQYMQIVAMSARLQAQSAEDLRRWKAEKEEWEKQTESFIRRIQNLESTGRATSTDPHQRAMQGSSQSEHSGAASSALAQTSSPTMNDVLASRSLDELRMEVVNLRARCQDMEAALKELSEEAERFETAMGEAKQTSHRIRSRVQAALLP